MVGTNNAQEIVPNSNPDDSLQDKEKIQKVIDEKVLSADINLDKNEIFYFYNNNFLKTSAKDISPSSVASYPFEKIDYIIWSEKKDKALIKEKDGFFISSFKENKTTPIKEKMDVAVLNRYGDKIIFKDYDAASKKRKIKIFDLFSNQEDEISEIEEKMVDFKINPTKNEVLVFSTPSAFRDTNAFLVDLEKKEKKQIFKGKTGVNFLWSPNGDRIIFSFTSPGDKSKTDLGVMNKNGGEVKVLNLPTLAEKCVWSDDDVNIYCAALTDIPTTAVMPDDWISGRIKNKDVFWRINTQTGKKERVAELDDIDKAYDGYNFFIDKEKEGLFFINKNDGALYRISL